MTLRGAGVAVVALSWLAVSNHCALGLAISEAHQSDAVSMHDCCASEVPVQPKPTQNPATPCCKTLQALSVSPAKLFEVSVASFVGAPPGFSTPVDAVLRNVPVVYHFLDNGPPGG